ncbi:MULTISPECIES: hypothetical protein [Streptomyces]|uniref:HTH luxR-type domain-containing protein n=2 Tax=Streptomyces TaxID=1883 RepID=A0ABU4KI28_9ACTN|nr:hypothetical protein [Streptomyces roseolus]MDX2297443.1 hypothetical protein [Streptomyces roseolus]
MSLANLGLTGDQEALYRRLLRGGSATAAEGPALRGLRELGLVDAEAVPVPPATAVNVLLRRRAEEIRRQLPHLDLVWDLVAELSEEHRGGRPTRAVEHIGNPMTLTHRIQTMLVDRPGEFSRLAGSPWPHLRERAPFRRALAGGLLSRTLLAPHAVHAPERLAETRARHSRGDLHRVTTEPVHDMALVNRSVAFAPADPADPEAGTLQIRHPGLVSLLADVFDGMWARAHDLDDPPVNPIERQVLHALARHPTDEAAARSVQLSVRKFRAHVADLMGRLGAQSRFQAALLAKERGWL